ncbi:MAG TPA: TonB-dependent receptor [Novosphingobium sp.]|nr:TonB-dependent receptor [Novosphingobium sp.]
MRAPGLLPAALLAAAGWVGGCAGAAGVAQAGTSPQAEGVPLGPALAALAREGGWQVLFTPDVVAGCRVAVPEAGHVPASRAQIERMLAPCHLRARWLAPALVLVERRVAPPHAPPHVEARLPAPVAPPRADGADILVTALRHETKLHLTPIAMSVATGQDLGRSNDASMAGLARLLPALGLFDTGTAQQRLILRGISGSGEPTVAVYYGETPVSGPAGTTLDAGSAAPDLALVDVDRVELIRGPQGTLFGASAMGGALRVLFHRPDLARPSAQVSGGVVATQGAPVGGTASGVLNLPLVRDRLGLRMVGYAEEQGGYVRNVTLGLADRGRQRKQGARAALLWEPAPGWQVEAMGAYQHLDTNDSQYWTAANGTHNLAQTTVVPMVSDLAMASLTASAALRPMALLLTASHYSWKQVRNGDYNAVISGARSDTAACQRYENQNSACTAAQLADYGAYVDSRMPAVLHQPFTVMADSVELRATSPARSRLWTWTAGLFMQSRRDRADSYAVRADATTGQIIEPLDITGYRHISTDLTQWAVFGEVTRNLTGRLQATAGLRHFNYLRTAANSVPVPNVITGTADVDTLGRRAREGGQIGKLGLTWRPGAQRLGLMVYASATQGYRPGGINITPGLAASQITYRSDSLVSYEVGAKYHPASGALGVDVALYHIDWSDMIYQVQSASGAFSYNTNVGNVAVDGGELSLRWVPWARGSLRLEASLNNAHLTADQQVASAAGMGHRGDSLPNAPRTSGSLDYTHNLTPARDLSGSVTVGAAYVGGYASQFNPGMTLYARTGAAVTLRAQGNLAYGRYGLSLSIDNLLGSNAAARVQPMSDGSTRVYGIAPRTLRLVGSARF